MNKDLDLDIKALQLKYGHYQLATNFVVVGSIGILIATFLTGKSFVSNLVFWKNPISYLFLSGMSVILAGTCLIYYLRNKQHKFLKDLYQFFLDIGLFGMVISISWTLILFILNQSLS